MASRVEVGVQIHPVEHVRDKLLQEQAGRNPYLATQPAGHGAGQGFHVGIIDHTVDARLVSRAFGVDVAYPRPYCDQGAMIEGR